MTGGLRLCCADQYSVAPAPDAFTNHHFFPHRQTIPMDFFVFETALTRHAQQLPYETRIARGIAICERLYPYYKTFVNENGFGEPEVLLAGMRFAASGSQDAGVLENLLESLEEVCPDTDDYEAAEYALNACGAVNALLLQVAEPNDAAHFVEVALSYYDTVEGQVQDQSDDAEPDEALEQHPLLAEARRFLLGQ